MKFMRFLLFPIALIYDLVTRIRNYCFDTGIYKTTTFKLPIIAVGNLSVGGTGKTPQIEYLIRLLIASYNLAILSRGYKRNTTGFVLLNNSHTAADVGDEPLQYFKKFKGISVAVDANRVQGIQQLQQLSAPEVLLLDDAYQHRKVTAGLYVLLTKFGDLYVDDYLLPTGDLRESKRGAKRAQVILVTKCPKGLSVQEQDKIIKKIAPKPDQHVFFTAISYAAHLQGSLTIPVAELVNFEVLLLTGIANPTPLLEFLTSNKVNYTHLKFADHHHFSTNDIQNIKQAFDQVKGKNKLILTTEKDYMRLSNQLENVSYLEIETQFLGAQQKDFNAVIAAFLDRIVV